MHRVLTTRAGHIMLGSVLAVLIAVGPAAAAIALAEQANVFDGVNLGGSSTYYVYGSSDSQLPVQWDN